MTYFMAFIAREPFKQGGPNPIKFNSRYESLRIINTGAGDLTFSVSDYFAYTLSPGEVFDEQVDPFDTLKIAGNGSYRGFVRKEVVGG
jgi:hypothetical protein